MYRELGAPTNPHPTMSQLLEDWLELLKLFRPDPDRAKRKRRWFPSVKLLREPDAVIVLALLPGFSAEEIDVQVTATRIYLAGSPSSGDEGLMPRVIPLPFAIDVDRVEAHYREGVLRVVCPSAERERRIDIS
ncbi:MAG: Hsp20/alpha crystallin family protein [Armatimonadetes bacterium]|nr:Hsp20/alpha crystallin family protein [Armatimonadota bacterium]